MATREDLENLYVLYNTVTKSLYRAQNWAGGRPSTELKTWKTLKGATTALAKLQNLVLNVLLKLDC